MLFLTVCMTIRTAVLGVFSVVQFASLWHTRTPFIDYNEYNTLQQYVGFLSTIFVHVSLVWQACIVYHVLNVVAADNGFLPEAAERKHFWRFTTFTVLISIGFTVSVGNGLFRKNGMYHLGTRPAGASTTPSYQIQISLATCG
jgi:hypothetical protein